MKKTDLIKMILPGLLPLLVFILADEIWGTTIGLYVAVAFGLVQLLVIYIKEKKLDKFVLFDTLLIVVMGVVSIILENDIFFKLKPGIIGLILITFLGVSAYSPKNLLLSMSAHYIKGIELNKDQQKVMLHSIKVMFWLFAIHTLLVIYSAFYMSKEAWAFISGGLFYILFAVFFVLEFMRNILNRRKISVEEILPEVDNEGNIIGRMTRTEAHSGTKRLHPVIHVQILNDKGHILLQKRSMNKKIQPGKWDTAVGGHISLGEKIETALERETLEELGLKDIKYQFLTKYIWDYELETELVFVFSAIVNDFLFVKNNEVDEAKYWTKAEITKNLKKGVFTQNFEIEFANIISKIRIKTM